MIRPASRTTTPLRRFLLRAFAALAFGASGAANAQYQGALASTWNNPVSAAISVHVMSDLHMRMLQRAATSPDGPAALQAQAEMPLSATSFHAGQPRLPAQLAASTPNITAQEREQLRQLYLALLEGYERALVTSKEERLRGNVAGALTYLISAAHFAQTGVELNATQTEALLHDVNAALAGSQAFQRSSPQAKQDMYEAFVITGGFTLALLQEAQQSGSESQLRGVRDLSAQLLREVLGPDAQRVHFTDRGITLK